MASCEIKPFGEEHLEDAARLFAERIRTERELSPLLPVRFEDHNTILPVLEKLSQKSPGVAAISKNKLVGFMIGWLLPSWRGRRSVCVPEWAHAEIGETRVKVFNTMYERIAREWVRDGCFTHLVGVLAHDSEIIDALFWLGFGLAAVDAMRDLGDVEGPFADVEIRRAGIEDLDVVLSLSHGQEQYIATSPTFMALLEKTGKESCEKLLQNPSVASWLAVYNGEAVSRLQIGPSHQGAARVISDDKTASITAAFTKEHVREQGIGANLLKHSLDWARSAGYVRCAVDFEPENVLGRSFWLKHFQPVCYALIRQIDLRIA
ncbi:hypothetical protein CEE36_07245 [candidate division TA06 bacterium B3_TA06]|uniref:N-acetyltransferase domain-containing protein n=1 Tax=candidate division TA06 bacterium B3_TA06 TaxID=2012487 RepID=A0A532V674_UNCT6|nr:MAG: hypothetical protein CEE36_07245 [candidate division TA06 bacterium B3_TA06]